jgi:riboflavin kinase/FMN adenylyltransferase
MQSVIALGFFDGVHLGHGDLLTRAAAVAAEHGWRSAALTFDRSPGKDGRLLTAVDDRARLIRSLYGVEEVVVLPFTEEFKHLDWETFLESLVREREAAHLICGWDYRFGHLGRGTPELLRAWCDAHGLGCDVIPPRVIDGVTVSSTYIKTLVEAGDVETAARFYGHPHSLTGTVRTGRGLGHTLGFPTANLLPAPELVLPRDGVYAIRCFVNQGTVLRLTGQSENRPLIDGVGVCNVGVRPTVDGRERTVETWLADFDGDLYGRTLTVEFCRFLRPEQKFPDLEALRRQVETDREAALAYFEQRTSDACPYMP